MLKPQSIASQNIDHIGCCIAAYPLCTVRKFRKLDGKAMAIIARGVIFNDASRLDSYRGVMTNDVKAQFTENIGDVSGVNSNASGVSAEL